MARRFTGSWLFLSGALGFIGCSGSVDHPGVTGEAGSGGQPSGGSGGATRSDGDAGLPPVSACDTTEIAPPAAALRRLDNTEYDRSVQALLGTTGAASADHGFAADPSVDGFENNVDALRISAPLVRSYHDAAKALASSVVADPDLRRQVIGCDLASAERATCLDSFVRDFGRRSFRRGLTEAEHARLLALAHQADADADPWRSAQLVIQAVLQAPSFLYRVEQGAPDASRPELNKLAGTEIATRLAYLIWQTPPDPSLLDAAENGDLDSSEGVTERARAMLDDPRAREAYRIFYDQWLRFDELRSLRLSPADYPEWSAELRTSMLAETEELLDSAWSGNLLDVVTADPDPAAHRIGILTHPSVLALTGRDEGKAPILRGKYVRDVLLCSPPPPPPENIPALPPAAAGQTTRARLAAHRENPDCATCHRYLDPIGFGLERYDLLGRYREVDPGGNPLSGEGELVGSEPAVFVGADELAPRIRESPQLSACVVRHVAAFALGRKKSQIDACTVETIDGHFSEANGSFEELVLALVASDTFRYVQGGSP